MSKRVVGIIIIWLLLYFLIFNVAGSGMATMAVAIGITNLFSLKYKAMKNN